jgi:AmmeMemoRadiSam system protein B
MKNTRPTAVAGLFYPMLPSVLAEMVNNDLAQASSPNEKHIPKALIVPHAGYIYSGPVAASAYQYLSPIRDIIKRVIIIGPSHRLAFKGVALSSADYFETPLGTIPIDKAAQEKIVDIAGVQIIDLAHASEHSLEVQLPFLQQVLDDFSIVPIVAGDATPELIENVITALWGGPETVFIISSDLSHYHDYQIAQQIDGATSQDIIDLNFRAVHSNNACGCVGIRGLLKFAHQHPLKPSVIDLRNSGDTAGSKDSVVGYGAYLFEEMA